MDCFAFVCTATILVNGEIGEVVSKTIVRNKGAAKKQPIEKRRASQMRLSVFCVQL